MTAAAMHVETLKTFCDLVETGSLSRAAKLNRVSQSAVSQQLRALEQRYGRRLVDRGPRVGARATEAGRALYEELRVVLARLEAVERRLRSHEEVVAGTVHVATVYSVGLHTLPPLMKRMAVTFPQVRVRLEYRRTDEVYDACLAGEIDLGIVALPRRRAQLEVLPLRPDELVIIGPPGHPRLRARRVGLAALAGQPFIAFERDIPTRKLVDHLLRRHQVGVQVTMELDNIETIKRSVEAGLGLSLLPAQALANEVRARTLVTRRPAEGPLWREIGAIYRRTREPSPAARAFQQLLRAELGAAGA
jgi:LysR family transcriptional regulator, transcriptional activator of the cysJI operon